MLVLLLGISGAGKTTIGEAVAASSPITYVYATAEKLRLVRAGEELNLLDQRRTYEVNEDFFDKLRPRREALLVDTHATYPFGDGFVKLTPPSVCPRVSGIVFVEADAATIQRRRIVRGRTHEPTELRSILREAAAERAEVERLRRAFDIPVCELDSTRVSVEEAASITAAFVDRLRG